MKKSMYVLIGLVVLACFVSAAAADTTGGERGFIQVKCNVDGASASLVNINNQVYDTQIITNGQCEFIVYTTGTPVNRVIVSKEGYFTNGAEVSNPAAGKTEFVTVNLDSSQGGLVGGDRGIYKIQTNVIGAKVSLISISGDESVAGYTDIYGVAQIPVYTTGTPSKGVKVSAPGWTTVERDDLQVPAAGQTLTYSIQLQPLNPTSAPTVPPASPVPIAGILAGLAVLGAAALIKRD
ncbi:MAG TPA: hypothetical protein O0X39_07275 [Methanocorpusculum sp.]|nr:hypothetical protein [Methanocorpusculum sp.]